MIQLSLSAALTPVVHDWIPQEPPDLSDVAEIVLDVETSGLRWWGGDYVIGIAVATLDSRTWYLPVRHRGGGNLSEETVRRWALEQLRGKIIYGHNIKFDAHMLRVFGVDLEELGCSLRDTGNWAALLDDHRESSSLEFVAQDYLKRGKIRGLDAQHMADYHASQVAGYARRDVELVRDLRATMLPLLDAEGLRRVQLLEDEVIFAVIEMEKNGSPLDGEKLKRWVFETEQEYHKCLWEIRKMTGIMISPSSRDDLKQLFNYCGVRPSSRTPKGELSFTRASIAKVQHPAIAKLRRGRSLFSLRVKFLLPYLREWEMHSGLLLYSLHQLPIDDEGGTRSGRFSSSSFGVDPPEGRNIQQVAGKKHAAAAKDDAVEYRVRELHVPAPGMQLLSADAEQIEYRFFAHYAKPPRVLAAYKDDPRTDFHNFVWKMIQEILPEITRERTKDINFAKIYGAGLKKIAVMLGFRRPDASFDSDEGLDDARPFVDAYDRVFPEAKRLLRRASDLAEGRGFVKTMMGRRSRFINGEPTHSALNRVIQGSAADENKLKLRELHRERRYTGLKLRFTVHDEAVGDAPDEESARRVAEVLNRQLMPTHVPLLWAVKIGSNWSDKSLRRVA